ncbi:hypothetical protein LTR62_004443 [Meristemomyces frigidus]|uniref:CAP-Gly domain-containing protein n=1 Tax=Meristemomyces frigidus TaxID=1508187 RepID=A0AAN7YJX6_9PEZI|nr:hypothetical protein LTR62_004443 [Meristemomyces frigidus]
MNVSQLAVGQKIVLADDRLGTIRYLGATHFQTGDWVGVELDEASGKNDGSVKGERYFSCEPDHGMFLRPGGVKQVAEDVRPKAAAKASNGVAGRSSRPSSVHMGVNGLRREAAEGPGRRASSIGGSPTPGAQLGSGLRSPTKSPSKQLSSNGVTSSTSTSRTNTPPAKSRLGATGPPVSRPRQSMAPPNTTAAGRRTSTIPSTNATAPSRSARPSLAPPSTSGRFPASKSPPVRPTAPRVPPSRAQQDLRTSSTTGGTGDDESERPSSRSPRTEGSMPSQQEEQEEVEEEEAIKPSFAPPPIPPDPPAQTTRSRRPSSPTAASIHSQRTMRSTAASNRQIEELEAKVRMLERKRLEDREVKKSLDQMQQERDHYKGIIEKLQNKYRPQQQELIELKQALSAAEKRFSDVEAIQAEHDSIMELTTLDREMAEEKAEGMQAELEALRAKNEEMELELEILKEENADLGKEMSPEERTSAGWAQMEKSNERLRDALLRLRDITQDKEAELKERVDELEEQAKGIDTLQAQYGETHEKLLRSEADTRDLKQQLEVALESDEMIEELTDRNSRLDITISQLRTTIEELEDLRDINDELQINYSEQEKQLQEEIDFKDSLLHDRERTAKEQQSALDEADYTVTRYRTLVSQMQSHLADMQASKRLSEAEAKELNDKARGMIDMNMRLQSSAEKTKVKTIELELGRLEAEEASQHLAIVQLFLPDAFATERDSVLALLRFKRLAFKTRLVQGLVRDRIASAVASGRLSESEDVFAACDVVDQLTWIAAMAERFINSISSCSAEEFARYESAFHELETVERGLNTCLEGLRNGELSERRLAQELKRSVAVMEHLASIHVKAGEGAGLADKLGMSMKCVVGGMEGVGTGLELMKGMIRRCLPTSKGGQNDDEDEDEDEDQANSELALLLNRLDALISSSRNAKVMAGKTLRSLGDLHARSLMLETEHAPDFADAETAVATVAAFVRNVGEAVQNFFGDEGRDEPFTADEITGIIARVANEVFDLHGEAEAGPFSTLSSKMRALQDQLVDLAQLPTDLDNTVEFELSPAPWLTRSTELKTRKDVSIDIAAQLSQTLERLRESERVLKEKEIELEEQSLRIEMLEARMREASKRSAKIAELEKALLGAEESEKEAKREVERVKLQAISQVERAREEVGRITAKERGTGDTNSEMASDALGAGSKVLMMRLEHRISSLEGAIRFLQDENSRLRLPAPNSPLALRQKLDWLHQPLHIPTTSSAAAEKSKKQTALRQESRVVLSKMLAMAAQPGLVDLSALGDRKNKLGWRPKREVAAWRVARAREEWVKLDI